MALHSYESSNPEDLSFQQGDKIKLLSKSEASFFYTSNIHKQFDGIYDSNSRFVHLQLTKTGWKGSVMGILVYSLHPLWKKFLQIASDLWPGLLICYKSL